MKKTAILFCTSFLSLSLLAQSPITEAEAREFMEYYLSNCMTDKGHEFFDQFFDIEEEDEEGFYLKELYQYQYKISAVDPPWVGVTASHDDPEKWDRIFQFKLKKKEGKLFIEPKRIDYWLGHNTLPYQDERIIGRPYSPSDRATFRQRLLGRLALKEGDLVKTHPALAGEWILDQCPECEANSYLTILKYLKHFHFQANGRFASNGDWFIANEELFIQFPNTGDYKRFDFHPLQDGTLWLSHELNNTTVLGMHLIPRERADERSTAEFPQAALPNADILIQPIYDDLECLKSGRILFESNGKQGALNGSGEIAIPAIYDKIVGFDEAGYTYANKDGKAALLNLDGEVIKTFDFKVEFPWMDGQLFIAKNGKAGIIDSLGNYILSPIYDAIQPGGFSYYQVCLDDKWGLMTLDGQEIIPPIYDGIEFRTKSLTIVKKDMRYGVMDIEKKELLLPIEFSQIKIKGAPFIQAFKDGKAMPYYLDGSTVGGLEFDYMEWLGWDYLGVEQNGKRGVINGADETVLPIKYDDIMWADLSLKGFFEVKLGEEEFIIDTTETIIPEEEFEQMQKWADQVLEEELKEDGLGHTKKGSALTAKKVGEYYAFFDPEGKMVIPPLYEDSYGPAGKGLRVVKGGFHGIIDESGQVILPFIFDWISPCSTSNDGSLIVEYQGKMGMLRLKE